MTPTDRCRPFSLGDGMILTSALAAWLAHVRSFVKVIGSLYSRSGIDPFAWSFIRRHRQEWSINVVLLIPPLLTYLGLAYLVIRLRRPRPVTRELVRQPGMAFCLLIAAVVALAMAVSLVFQDQSVAFQRPLGFALLLFVPLAWLTLRHRGSLRPEPGWIDRLGRSVAALWCIASLLVMIVNLLVF